MIRRILLVPNHPLAQVRAWRAFVFVSGRASPVIVGPFTGDSALADCMAATERFVRKHT